MNYQTLSISQLARLISKDWAKVNYAAVPYLAAMRELETVDSSFDKDDGRQVVGYFLSNASSWRGDTAKAIKAELKRRLGR